MDLGLLKINGTWLINISSFFYEGYDVLYYYLDSTLDKNELN